MSARVAQLALVAVVGVFGGVYSVFKPDTEG
jgi:hypothetical protein